MATDGPGKAPGHSTRFYAAVSIAAAFIVASALGRLFDPQPLLNSYRNV